MKTINEIFSKDNVLSKVEPIVLSKSDADSLLEKGAVIDYMLDFGIAYTLPVETTDTTKKCIRLTESMINSIDISHKELKEAAAKNSESNYKIIGLNAMLDSFVGEQSYASEQVYILTSTYGSNAGIIISDKVMIEMESTIKGTFFILPSSIHEVLCVSDKGMTSDDLRKMVQEVNEEVVDPEERLSDNVYYWDGSKLTIA